MSTLTVELPDEVARLVEETARERKTTPAGVIRQWCIEAAFKRASRTEGASFHETGRSTNHLEVSRNHALGSQLEALATLKDGWMEGAGKAPMQADVDWLADQLVVTFPADLPVPFVCATPAGGVFLEWALGDWVVSAEFPLPARTCELQAVNTKSSESKDQDQPLNGVADFAALYDFVRQFV